MSNRICLKVVISGKVQGVGYRYSTQKKAQDLGLVGWVRNLDDGRVEVRVEGERRQVDMLMQWFNQGPPMAEVDRVDVGAEPLGEFRRFEILR